MRRDEAGLRDQALLNVGPRLESESKETYEKRVDAEARRLQGKRKGGKGE